MTFTEISQYFSSDGTIRRTAKAAGISEQKCRKILITNGDIYRPRTDEIVDLMKEGLTIDEIATKLGVVRSTVSAYLPYIRGEYKSDAPTENSLKLRKWREKNKNKAAL